MPGRRKRKVRITEDYAYARPRTKKNPQGLDRPTIKGTRNPFMFMGERKRKPPSTRRYRKAKKIALAKSIASPRYEKMKASHAPYSPSNPAYPSKAAKRAAMRKMGKFRPGAKRVALGKRGIRRKRKVNIFGQLGKG